MYGQGSTRDTLFASTVRVVVETRVNSFGGAVALQQPEVGTAFIVHVGGGGNLRFYLVTAAHVVENADIGALLFRRHPKVGDEPCLYQFSRRRFGELWWYPKECVADVAITPLSFGEIAVALTDHDATVVASPFWSRDEDMYLHPHLRYVRPFEEVLFAGYPLGLWDPTTASPIVRRGVSATSIAERYRGDPAFLIDGAVYPGCSGGPVLVIERELVIPPDAGSSWGERVREEERVVLLGLITDLLEKESAQAGVVSLQLAVVLRAELIFKAIAEYERFVTPPAA